MKRNAILLAMLSIMTVWLGGCITTHSPSETVVTIKVGDSQTFTVAGVANSSYTWKKGGVVISGNTTASYTYNAVLEELGTFTIEVSTKDALNTTSKFVWTVTVVNDLPPTANAGPDQNLIYPNPIQLDGSLSADPEGQTLNYVWEIVGRPAGSSCSLDDPTAKNPVFVPDKQGAYTVALIVNDGRLTSEPDVVIINSYVGYAPPTANAGEDQSIVFNNTVTLDGSESSDPSDAPLTYQWKIDSGPAGSAASFDDPTKVNPKFTPDKKGIYVCSLVVNNSVFNSGIDLVTIVVYNNPPVAWAGTDITVAALGGSATLDGSGSVDPDEQDLTYAWTIISRPYGSIANLSNPSIAKPTFTPDKKGAYIMKLIVNDGDLSSNEDTVIVTCSNGVPVANAGDPIIVPFHSTAQLNGSATDPDSDPMTYTWTEVTRPLGSTAVLSSTTILNPTFTPDVQGSYQFALVATDNTGLSSAPSTVMISTGNHQPLADAGDDVIMAANTSVGLNGSGTDVDSDPLTYTWRVITAPMGSGGDSTLSALDIANPTFTPDLKGDYVLGLVVNDGQVDSVEDTLKIHVINNQPIAEAGPAQTARVSSPTVTLDGSGSLDPDGDPLTYTWRIISKPAGSTSVIIDPHSVNPTFTIDRATGTNTDYVFGLMVNDGYIDSAEDTVTVTLVEHAPVANAGSPQSGHAAYASRPLVFNMNSGASSDPDGDPILGYTWSLVSGSASISDIHAANPTVSMNSIGSCTIGLVVSDGWLSSTISTVTLTYTNATPSASAGTNQSSHATYGTPIVFQLNGSGSSDGDSDPLTYTWRVISGTGTLSDSHAMSPTLTKSDVGACQLGLIVNDGFGNSAESTVTMTYTNNTPVANAGSNQSAHIRYGIPVIFNLTGDGTDADNDELAYTWRVISGTGTLSNTHAVSPTLTKSDVGACQLGLVVNDGFGNSTESTVIVTTTNTAPVANAGTYSPVLYANRNTVSLSGSGSDPDGDPMTSYSWTQTGGTTVTLNNANTATPWFAMATPGTYTFQLTVSDGFATGSSTASVVNSTATYFTGWEGASWNDSRGVAWTTDTDNTDLHAPTTANKRTGSYGYQVRAKSAPFPYTNKYWDNRIRSTFSPSVYVISVTLYTVYSNVALCGGPTLTLYKDGGSLATISSGTGWTTYTRAINALTSSIGLHTNVCSNVSGKSNVYWDDISIEVWN